LVLLLQSQYFKDALSAGTSGISKARVKPSVFLDIQIPLPSLEEQNNIVAAYNATIAQADNYVQQADDINDQIETYLKETLGVEQNNTSSSKNTIGKFIWLVHLKNITRWDVYNSQDNNYNGTYDYLLLRDLLISSPKYGAGYKAEKKRRDVRYIRITDINEDGSLNDDFASVAKYDNQYLLKQNDFLIARTGNTVGKTFLYDESLGKAIYAGYLIKFELDTSKVNPQYLLAYTKSSVYKTWIKNNMRISAQPNINSKQYEESPIILPPLAVQNEIVDHISALRAKQKHLQQQASDLRTQAAQQYEQTIFN
jgi:type I restriction enzyme S subunit